MLGCFAGCRCSVTASLDCTRLAHPPPRCPRLRTCWSKQVTTLDRWSRRLSVVGWAVLHLYIDPKTQQQPVSSYIHDYVLNQVRGCVRVRVCGGKLGPRGGGYMLIDRWQATPHP